MDKATKLQILRDTAWELLKHSPKDLKECGIDPIALVGANFSTKEMLADLGIDVSQEYKR